jgi:hypothetical protein
MPYPDQVKRQQEFREAFGSEAEPFADEAVSSTNRGVARSNERPYRDRVTAPSSTQPDLGYWLLATGYWLLATGY